MLTLKDKQLKAKQNMMKKASEVSSKSRGKQRKRSVAKTKRNVKTGAAKMSKKERLPGLLFPDLNCGVSSGTLAGFKGL